MDRLIYKIQNKNNWNVKDILGSNRIGGKNIVYETNNIKLLLEPETQKRPKKGIRLGARQDKKFYF